MSLTEEEITSAKEAFARGLLRGLEPYSAVCLAVPDPNEDRVRMALEWRDDPEVARIRVRIGNDPEDPTHDLPTKVDFLRTLYEKFCNSEGRDAAALAKSYAEIRGFVRTPGNEPKIVVNNAPVAVMRVRDYGSDDDWERRTLAEQNALIARGEEIVNASH